MGQHQEVLNRLTALEAAVRQLQSANLPKAEEQKPAQEPLVVEPELAEAPAPEEVKLSTEAPEPDTEEPQVDAGPGQ